jgi:ferredoxin
MDHPCIKKVFIKPGCITCGLCEFVAPKVFEVTDVSHVIPGADLVANQAEIKEAALMCPVEVIGYEQDTTHSMHS